MARSISSNKTRFRPSVEPSVEDLLAVRVNTLLQATSDAFAASTLAEAQAILGGANPALTTGITLSADFVDVSSAFPADSATRIVTVPTGNPGRIHVATNITVRYSINGAGFVSLTTTGGVITLASADTLQFRRATIGTAVISLTDDTTGAPIQDDFSIEAT